jgi:dTDP-glucose 4,6-dehydratase
MEEDYSKTESLAQDEQFLKEKISESLAKKVELVAELFKEKKINLQEAGVILGISPQEAEAIFVEKGFSRHKKILVCGGAGFIGSNFVHYMLDKYPNYKIINYDKLTYAGNLENIRDIENHPRYKFIKGDITDQEKIEKLIEEEGIDAIVNFAAETAVGRSVHGRAGEFIYANVLGPYTLLEATKKYNIPKYIQVSTDEVFGTVGLDEDRKFLEDSSFEPNVPYAAAKAGGDLVCRAYWQTYKVPVIVTHCSNNYGPYQHPEKMIPYFIFRAMNRQPLPLHGDGRHVRDWIYALDHCEAIDLILQKGQPGEVYNISSDNEKPNLEIAKLILNILGQPHSLITFVPDRPGNDRRYSIDSSKIRREVGWKPSNTFEEAMPKTIQWYQNNLDWVEKIKERDREFVNYI